MQTRTALLACLAIALAGTADADPNRAAGRRPGSPGVTYDAVVSEHGVLGRNTGAVSASEGGRGDYAVAFADDLTGCAVIASLARATSGGGEYEKPGFIATSFSPNEPKVVFVRTGGVKGRQRERSFHLVVGC